MPESIKRRENCKACKDGAKSATLPIAAKQIGATVVDEYLGGKDTDKFSYYQCSECGSVWEKLAQRGAGGHHPDRIRCLAGS